MGTGAPTWGCPYKAIRFRNYSCTGISEAWKSSASNLGHERGAFTNR